MKEVSKEINSRHGNKKLALLLVLKALEQMSDRQNPIKQITLAKMVNDIGGMLNLDIWCDRKTVGRHLKLLKAIGYKIVCIKGKGFYLESDKFTKNESELTIKIISQSDLPDSIKNMLIEKLIKQQANIDMVEFNNYFTKVKGDSKNENCN